MQRLAALWGRPSSRDAIVAEALPLVQRGSKSLQGSLGKARLREMGPYGYTVNDTPLPPKAKS